MADEMQVGRARIKRRNPWGVWLLTLITVGIYGLVWYFKINAEMRDYKEGTIKVDPVLALVAITIGSVVVIPPFVSYYKTADRVQQAQIAAGTHVRITPILALLLGFIGFYQPYVQSQLNKAWDVEFDAAAGAQSG